MANMHTMLPALHGEPAKPLSVSMNIGTTIRDYRLQKSMSQGDIEKRTGLLRCYLSRVEKGTRCRRSRRCRRSHGALDLQLAQFFAEDIVTKEVSVAEPGAKMRSGS